MTQEMTSQEGSIQETETASSSLSAKITSTRGFASMDEEKQREIARKGGKAAHEQGVAHKFTSEEAREAGRKGGLARGLQYKYKAKEDDPQRAEDSGARG